MRCIQPLQPTGPAWRLSGAFRPPGRPGGGTLAFGIKPETIVDDHLNQPRELVKGEVVSGILS